MRKELLILFYFILFVFSCYKNEEKIHSSTDLSGIEDNMKMVYVPLVRLLSLPNMYYNRRILTGGYLFIDDNTYWITLCKEYVEMTNPILMGSVRIGKVKDFEKLKSLKDKYVIIDGYFRVDNNFESSNSWYSEYIEIIYIINSEPVPKLLEEKNVK